MVRSSAPKACLTQTSGAVVYAVEEDKHFKGRCNQYSKPHLLVNLDEYLSEGDWKRLMDSPLGGIPRLGTRVHFSAQLVHYVLQRQLKTKKKHETWYKIQDAVVRFSIAEFAIVTDLNCSFVHWPEEDETDKSAMRDFFGVESLKMSEFEVRFLVDMKSERSAAQRFKFALLMLVEGVLFGKEPRNYLHPWVVNLVSDVGRILGYPWGRLCYECTHEFLKGAIERKLAHGIKANALRPAYCLFGFPLAFQLWVYEAIAPVADQCATLIDPDAYLRCLRYGVKEDNLEYDAIKIRLQEANDVHRSFDHVDVVLGEPSSSYNSHPVVTSSMSGLVPEQVASLTQRNFTFQFTKALADYNKGKP